MRISEHSTGDVTVLDLLTPLTGDHSKELFLPQIESMLAEGHRRFVLNLAELAWINSSGVGHLIGARRRIEDAGGEIVLSGVNDRVKGILEVTGLATLWPIHADVGQALQHWTKREEH